jgi:hypothetical protein
MRFQIIQDGLEDRRIARAPDNGNQFGIGRIFSDERVRIFRHGGNMYPADDDRNFCVIQHDGRSSGGWKTGADGGNKNSLGRGLFLSDDF